MGLIPARGNAFSERSGLAKPWSEVFEQDASKRARREYTRNENGILRRTRYVWRRRVAPPFARPRATSSRRFDSFPCHYFSTDQLQ